MNAIVSLVFAGAVLLLSVLFVGTEINTSREKTFWLDEYFAFASSVRVPSISSQLIDGAPNQGSPAPLDYVLLRSLDAVRAEVGYLGLEPLAYYRLVALSSILLAGILLAGGMWRALQLHEPRHLWVSCLCILVGLVALWFNPTTLIYAAEMRPYSLWNSLWVMCLGTVLIWPRERLLLVILLCLLSLTVTASIFQLFALFLACVTVRLIEKTPFKTLALECLAVFSIPTLISLYYVVRAGHWGYVGDEWGTWPQFFAFWFNSKWVLVNGGIAAVICALRKDTRSFAMAGLAVVFLYLMAPLIFHITRLRGFFFTERQYIYFLVAVPVLLFSLARCVPFWLGALSKRFRPLLAVPLMVCLAGLYALRFHANIETATETFSKRMTIGFPKDPLSRMQSLLQTELPKGFCVIGGSERIAANIELLRDWLPVRFSGLPQGEETIFLERDGETARVSDVSVRKCSNESFIAITIPQVRFR